MVEPYNGCNMVDLYQLDTFVPTLSQMHMGVFVTSQLLNVMPCHL